MNCTTVEAVTILKSKFSSSILEEINFHGQTTLSIDKKIILELMTLLKDELKFDILMDLTGIDYLFPKKHTKIVYLLHNLKNAQRIFITTQVDREEFLPSVTEIFEGANWYERELFDLFGVHFENHKEMKRILMPDDWEGHPLRKDYALTEQPVQFKHGVKPKNPSEIIPYVKKSSRT